MKLFVFHLKIEFHPLRLSPPGCGFLKIAGEGSVISAAQKQGRPHWARHASVPPRLHRLESKLEKDFLTQEQEEKGGRLCLCRF